MFRKLGQENIASTSNCLMLRNVSSDKLIGKFERTAIVQVASKMLWKINRLFDFTAEGDYQSVIMDPRRENLHFTVPEDPEIPDPANLQQMTLNSK